MYVQLTGAEFDLLATLQTKYNYYDLFEKIEQDLNQKLWHQLSDHLIQLSEKPELQKSKDLVEIYYKIVLGVERAFNPMKLMMIITNVIKNFSGI